MGDMSVVFAGDTSLGDWYLRRADADVQRRLEHEPLSFFEHLRPLLEGTVLVVNLETVLYTQPKPAHPDKKYPGWDNPDRTLGVLKELGVTAVSLANNHTMDFGGDVLATTAARLADAGIEYFGAGGGRQDASAPFVHEFSLNGHKKKLYVVGALKDSAPLREKYGFFAGEDTWGVYPLTTQATVDQLAEIRRSDPDAFIILFPHWGKNYVWASRLTQRNARRFIEAGADLILGHGAHMLQELVNYDDGSAALSLGNLVFNSMGRYQTLQAPPFSLIARMTLDDEQDSWAAELRYYPIVSDNLKTGFRPAPASQTEAEEVYGLLAGRSRPFADHFSLERDRYGWNIRQISDVSPRVRSYEATMALEVVRDIPAVSAESSSDDDTEAPVSAIEEAPVQGVEAFAAGSTSRLLAEAVAERGYPYTVYSVPGPRTSPGTVRTALRFTVDGRNYFIRNASIVKEGRDGAPGAGIDGRAVRICKRKDVTNAVLRQFGFSTPRGMSFGSGDVRGAQLYFDAVYDGSSAGLCVKPAAGNKGKKIFLNLTDRGAFTAAFEAVASEYSTVLVEESVTGDVYRFLSIGGQVVAVRRGVPASVVGDGSTRIAELVTAKNEDLRKRGADRHALLRLEQTELDYLAGSGRDADTVPARDERVFLSSLSNRHAAAEIIDCTDAIHHSYREIVEMAVQSIPDLVVCGADLMIADATAEAEPGNHFFIELNTGPGLRGHHRPSEGEPRDVAGMVIDYVAKTLL